MPKHPDKKGKPRVHKAIELSRKVASGKLKDPNTSAAVRALFGLPDPQPKKKPVKTGD